MLVPRVETCDTRRTLMQISNFMVSYSSTYHHCTVQGFRGLRYPFSSQVYCSVDRHQVPDHRQRCIQKTTSHGTSPCKTSNSSPNTRDTWWLNRRRFDQR